VTSDGRRVLSGFGDNTVDGWLKADNTQELVGHRFFLLTDRVRINAPLKSELSPAVALPYSSINVSPFPGLSIRTQRNYSPLAVHCRAVAYTTSARISRIFLTSHRFNRRDSDSLLRGRGEGFNGRPISRAQNDHPPILRTIKRMCPRFCDNFGIGYAAFDEQRTKRFRFDNFIPRLDRLQQFRVRLADGLPKCAVGRLEHLCAPDCDRKKTAWVHKTP
jgi:hypothetical protein